MFECEKKSKIYRKTSRNPKMSVCTDSQYNSTSTVVVILKEAMHVNGCVSKKNARQKR